MSENKLDSWIEDDMHQEILSVILLSQRQLEGSAPLLTSRVRSGEMLWPRKQVCLLVGVTVDRTDQ